MTGLLLFGFRMNPIDLPARLGDVFRRLFRRIGRGLPARIAFRRAAPWIFIAAFALGRLAGQFSTATPYAAAPPPARVALTFDDGPHPDFTPRLLDILRRHRARATFFVVGDPSAAHPDLLRRIARAGHEVANHTLHHRPLTGLSRGGLLSELDGVQKMLDPLSARRARRPRLFRPPGGRFDADVLSTARAAGYHMILWTVLPKDHDQPPADEILRRVLADVSDGGVILLHSGVESTVEALPLILDALALRGYRCVTVGDLLAHSRPTDPSAVWLDAPVLPGRELPPAAETGAPYGGNPS
jgi:peptidoglycan/xylan/chitin deacetylase (PgdA/CDA1 family)